MWQNLSFLGYVGNEPEQKFLPSGDGLLTLSVATNRSWKPKDSEEWKTETTWFRVVIWGKSSEYLAERLHKGMLVLVSGELVPDENGGPKIWTGKDGTPHASFEVKARTIKIAEKKSKGEPTESTEAVTDLEM